MRKLDQLHVSREVASSLIGENGLIDLLTVIPVSEILPKGIPYIRCHFDESGFPDKFKQFWRYFEL